MKKLPAIKHKGRWYYVDSRLWEIRNVKRPHISFPIDDLTNEKLVEDIVGSIPINEIILHY